MTPASNLSLSPLLAQGELHQVQSFNPQPNLSILTPISIYQIYMLRKKMSLF
jgi:hypothetical protein